MRLSRIWLALAVLVSAVSLLVLASPAFAYVDPGTTSAVFNSLAPLLGVLGTIVVAAVWPFRMLYRWTRSLAVAAQIGVLAGAVVCLVAVCFGVYYFFFV